MPLAPLLLTLLGLAVARAETAPMILPGRDVSVLYRLQAPGRPAANYRFQYDALGQRARITDLAQGIYFLVDLPQASAEIVVPPLRSVVNAPDVSSLTRELTDRGQDARFTPLGQDRYAGLACREWRVTGPEGQATACLTPDGVVLHFKGSDPHGAAEVTALGVGFAPQAAADFAPPPGFTALDLPPGVLQQLLNGGAPQ